MHASRIIHCIREYIVPLGSMEEDSFRVSRASKSPPPIGRVSNVMRQETAEDENRTSVKRDLLETKETEYHRHTPEDETQCVG